MAKTVAVIGATGTIGQAVARRVGEYHKVIPVSRHSAVTVDMTDEQSIRRFYEDNGPFDAVAVCAGYAPFDHVTSLKLDDFSAAASGKLLGQIRLVLNGMSHVNDGGSFTLISGILAQCPVAGSATASAANGGIESFTVAASTELPRGQRINTISPTVLQESSQSHSLFRGFKQVPASDVADAYLRSIDGVETGKIFRVWG